MSSQGLHACPRVSLDSTSQLLQYTLKFQGVWSSMCECVSFAGATSWSWQLDAVRFGCKMNHDGRKPVSEEGVAG
jgi:hypothetical protein